MNHPVESFFSVLTQAVAEFALQGYTPELLEKWQRRLRDAAILSLPLQGAQKTVQDHLRAIFRKEVEGRAFLRHHEGIARFTVDRLTPKMRLELDRRILASADLIRLNREQAIEKTMQRFTGWATSVPVGGSRVVDRVEVKEHIGKSLKQSRYEQRRVAIDQGHKLMSNINAVLAEDAGAIAMLWRSHWRQPGYNYRPDHKERDKKVYAMRGNWAAGKGLVNKGDGYLDELTAPAEEPFCRCFGIYLYNLRDLPADMLTAKGRKMLEAVRVR